MIFPAIPWICSTEVLVRIVIPTTSTRDWHEMLAARGSSSSSFHLKIETEICGGENEKRMATLNVVLQEALLDAFRINRFTFCTQNEARSLA